MRPSCLVALSLCVLLSLGAVPAATGPASLVRVERQAPDDLERLRSAGLPVIGETLGSLLVEGDASDLDRLRSLGYAVEILDADSVGADYLVVPLTADRTSEDVAVHGTVVLQEENLAFLRIPRGAGFPAGLEPGCFAVDLLNRSPVRLPAPRGSVALRGVDAAVPDPMVQQVVDAVEDAQILSMWQDITDNPPSGTRFSRSVGCEDAAQYCFDHYVGLGLDPAFDDWDPEHAPNVVAEMTGAVSPGEIYILVGHLDDLPSTGIAPGADDNGSGTVTVLEGARVLSCYGTKNTVRFLNVTGEEQGLLGSEAYAGAAKARGDDIRGVLNFDMNGWEGDGTPVPENIDVSYNSFSQWLGELYAENSVTYQTGLVVDAFYCPSLTASDHAAFWEQGYPAIIGITDNHGYCGHAGTYPDYHEATDTIENNGDPTLYYASVRTAVATLAELAEPFVVTFERGRHGCDDTAEVIVSDAGLNLDPGVAETVTVTVWSETEPAGETVVLTERGADSKLFSATFPLTPGTPVAGDGMVSVAEGDTLSTEYVDPLDCAGNADALYTATSTIDCTAPAISGVDETGITDTRATVVWSTTEPTSGAVVWGDTTPPTTIADGPDDATGHSVTLTGLQPCTVYYYEVQATDEAGNLAIADNGGRYYAFETLGDFGSGLQACHAGQVTLDQAVVSCTGEVAFEVVDLDLNLDPGVTDSATLTLTSTTETSDETVTVVETGPNTSTFRGTIATATGAPAPDGVLQTAHDDVVTATYHDADDGTGTTAISFDTGTVDCAGPVVSDLRVEAITDARATVTFVSDEPGDAVVEWGTTPSLGNVAVDANAATSHAVVLAPIDECGEIHFRVRTTDAFGHETVAEAPGGPHRFAAGTIPGLYWKDDFESPTTTWSLEGEWEVGAPQGQGGSSGQPDPSEAYNASGVLGHDLSGQGLFPGDYEPDTTESATSPQFDATTWTDTKLLLYRRLNVHSSDDASIWVLRPQGLPVYRSSGTTVQETGYSVQSFDLSGLVDGERRFTLEFRQQSGPVGNYSGWNVDDVILKDGSLPDYGPCGSCGVAPSFGGAVAADDDDACAPGGVTVRWDPATAWGSGGAGTYAVYRDTTAGFTPGPSNRVAEGVAGTSWVDTSAPADTDVHYLVRAENDETCSTGPANGGVTDGGQGTVVGRDGTSQSTPGAIAGLEADRFGGAHVRLSWDVDGAAATYRVYRSGSPDPATFVSIADATDAVHDDLGAAANLETYYYLVTGVDACGTEGP